MSIYWNLHCKSCDVTPTESDGFNRGQDILRSIYRLREAIVAIYGHGNYLDVEILGCPGDRSELWCFLTEHKDHEMDLLNEHGDVEPIEEVTPHE